MKDARIESYDRNDYVPTYRSIIDPLINQSSGEGANTQGMDWIIGFVISLVGIVALVYFLLVLGVPIVGIAIISVVVLIICLLIFPFKLKQRIDSLRKLSDNEGYSMSTLNKIISVDDNGMILYNNKIAYVYECIPNDYKNLNNYAEDFNKFIELFSDYMIDIKWVQNTDPIKYIDEDKLSLYVDKEVLFDRLELARFAEQNSKMDSQAYIIYVIISGQPFQKEDIERQIDEVKYSVYTRVFSSLKLLNREQVLKLGSRDLGVIFDSVNLYLTKAGRNSADDEIIIRREN